MTEQELLKQIRESANSLEIPDSLAPEEIRKKLPQKKQKRKWRPFPMMRAASAISIALFCLMLSVFARQPAPLTPESDPASGKAAAQFAEAGLPKESEASTQGTPEAQAESKRNAGTLYTVAKSYDEIYQAIKSSMISEISAHSETYYIDGGSVADGARKESSSDSSAASGLSAEKKEYSTTNLQTEGVDESDLVKTDGQYIYTVAGHTIQITKVGDGAVSHAASIDLPLDSSDSVFELYVDQGTLLALTQHYETEIAQPTQAIEEPTQVIEEPAADLTESNEASLSSSSCAKTAEIRTNCFTALYTYDITSPEQPSLRKTTTQEGYYHTSRKIGDVVYLFTQKNLAPYAGLERDDGIIPHIDGKQIPPDHIYLPESGQNGMVISSIDVAHDNQVMDQVMIVNNYAEVYMGPDALYLYHPDETDELTQIAKFEIKNSAINAVAAASVPGFIKDPFAIHEYGGALRVLSTSFDSNGESSNALHLFDSGLRLTASLDGIARGEEIYAARYFGDTAYFITYRNTDPLFAVDLSDPSNPLMLGQLEITGFSEYLHFWEEDKLLGIGYETDPDTGERKGLKLVMFDISDPAHLQTLGSQALTGYYYAPALYNYKCVLADASKNLIGFSADRALDTEIASDFVLFSWENGTFAQNLKEPLPQAGASDDVRSLYIGDYLYIVTPTEITSYGIGNGFQKAGSCPLEQ